MNVFKLPDLGEGLAEAEVLECHVKPGDTIKLGDPLVTVETAKAIVEIPSPRDGTIAKVYVDADDIIAVDQAVVAFAGDGDAGDAAPPSDADQGTVVGQVMRSDRVVDEQPDEIGQPGASFKALPAVRALARKLDVDLGVVTPSGPNGLITARDVERVARILAEAGPLEKLRGPRRAMARSMAQAHAEVADVTVNDDADIGDWREGSDVTIRLIRAIVAGCRAEPGLNAWYDGHALGRRVLEAIHLAVAVDTADGLFVPVLRDVANRSEEDLRRGLERLKADVRARTIPAEELRGYTITLSNYGVIGGRYSDPIVVPPTVAILGAGRVREEVVAHNGKPALRPIMPLSLTFDHRVVTGGEGARFLMAVIEDLAKAE
ncbi:MAG: dihydrolipoamide acetyltransferase family protein [Pseudomonas sp.]